MSEWVKKIDDKDDTCELVFTNTRTRKALRFVSYFTDNRFEKATIEFGIIGKDDEPAWYDIMEPDVTMLMLMGAQVEMVVKSLNPKTMLKTCEEVIELKERHDHESHD